MHKSVLKCNKKFAKILSSLVTYSSISIFLHIPFYNIFSIIIYIFVLLFYLKINLTLDKKINKYAFILSLFFSLTLSLGNIVNTHLLISDIGFINFKQIIKVTIMFFGFLPFFYNIFAYIFLNISKINIFKEDDAISLKKREILIIFLIILFCWCVLLLRFFPAIMTPDSYYVVHNAAQKILSDHHTFGHTWFFALFFYLGKFIFGTDNGGVFIYTIVQMIIMDLIFTFSINYLYRKGLKKRFCLFLILFIALNPLYSRYSVTLWRDVLFGMSFVVLFFCLYDYLIENYKISLKKIILFTISIFVILFFRNNGIYVFIFMTPFIILIGKKHRIKKCFYCICIISIYFVIKGPIFSYFGVQKGLSSEAYSIPIQQISRVVASKEKINSRDFEELKKVYNIEKAKSEYNPVISDKMKETINNDFLNKNKVKFFNIWFKLLREHPSLYLEAYFTQTLGYWYPDVEYWATGGEGKTFFEEDVKTTPLLNNQVNRIIDKTTSRKIPFSILIWSIGLNVELLIISTFIMIYKNKFKFILIYIPFYALWLTMMLATPVYAELRYVFGIFAAMPFILITPFMSCFDKKS